MNSESDGNVSPADSAEPGQRRGLAFVRGAVLTDLAEREARHRSGLDFSQYIAGHARYARKMMATGKYPRLTRYWMDAELPHAPDRKDRAFALGLESVLDGIAANVDGAGPGANSGA